MYGAARSVRGIVGAMFLLLSSMMLMRTVDVVSARWLSGLSRSGLMMSDGIGGIVVAGKVVSVVRAF